MTASIEKLDPKSLWAQFYAYCQIPHCSKDERAAGEYVISVAKKMGLEYQQDSAGNIVVRKPGSPSKETAPVVVLQSHLDMVCEKNSATVHDFTKDPIRPVIENGWVTADGTSLGADNGIGVAAALALMESKNLVHGPLELLFTTDEETGLNGANALQADFLKGRIMINMDSEEEGAFSIGCAGGGDSEITLPIRREAVAEGTPLKVMLSGLRGGHSGIDIHKGRGNATQLLARMLYKLDVEYDLVRITGGTKHNAIPREAYAYIYVQDEKVNTLKEAMHKRFDEICFEYKAVEKEMKLEFSPPKNAIEDPMDHESKNNFLSLLVGLPHGVMAMSQEIKGLVESSNNLAIVTSQEADCMIYTSTRSSIGSALEAVRSKIEAIASLANAPIQHLEGYPAWTPNLESNLLNVCSDIYKKQSGRPPRVEAIHAGLECGIIGEKYPGMDMISVGPDLENPHSPDERVGIDSVNRFWIFIVDVLETLAA